MADAQIPPGLDPALRWTQVLTGDWYGFAGKGWWVAYAAGGDPKHPHSWRIELDTDGNKIACIWSGNPNDPRSWRLEKRRVTRTVRVYGDGRVEEIADE